MENTEQNNEMTMEELMNEMDSDFIRIHTGDIIDGTILSCDDEGVIVNINYFADGIIPKGELSFDTNFEVNEIVNVGDQIKVKVLKVDDGEGNVLLSKKEADAIVIWDELSEIYEKEKEIEVLVEEVVKGGVVARYKGVRGFIPASLLSVEYIDDLSKFMGIQLTVKLVEYVEADQRVIFSRKAVEQEIQSKKKQDVLGTIARDKKYLGTVKRLVPYGAFVDIGGIDGLIHISDLSWEKVKHPSVVVNVGDQVEVYVIDFDKEKERISLGLKDVNDDPWESITTTYSEGDIVEGTVSKLLGFGAFVVFGNGFEGLVHISQICEKRILKPSEVLEEGEAVRAKILSIDKMNRKIGLSIREAKNQEAREAIPTEYLNNEESNEPMATLGDLLKGKLDLK